MPIYTRTGDYGETSLFGGKRVLKCDDTVELYGCIDELNSSLGHIVSIFPPHEVQGFLRDIQADLFSIGSFLAGWRTHTLSIKHRVKEMETRIDLMDAELPVLRQFILPGGSILGSSIHMTRSTARRIERKAVHVFTQSSDHSEIEKEGMKQIIQYINRLSDFLFVLARFVNKKEGVTEIEWSGEKKKD